jgi:hypothetical protein
MVKRLVLILLALAISSVAVAQDKIPIELGTWVKGEVTNDNYETKYTFSGTQGQLIMVAMMPEFDTGVPDPYLILRNSDGDIIAQNDDINRAYSLVVAELPIDDTFTVVATRSRGANGEGEGGYWLEVSEVQPLAAGDKTTVSIVSADEKSFPRFFVLRPDSSGVVKFGFNEASNGQYPMIVLMRWYDDGYPDFLITADNMNGIDSLAFSAELQADTFYILEIDPTYVFYGSDATAILAFSIN